MSETTLSSLVQRHRPTLRTALEVIRTRVHWSPYPDDAGAHPPHAPAAGHAAFKELLGKPLELDGQPGVDGAVGPGPREGGEHSPYGFSLGISYPHIDPDVLLPAMAEAMPAWRDVGAEVRAAVCLEILDRLHARSFEFAHAAMHTSGHGFLMGLHAGAAHAQDRGLEAVAHAYAEQTRVPAAARWERPRAEGGAVVLTKSFKTVPRGISLLLGCRTFPAWNGAPGLFASLATGNPVLVKPHPRAVLPLALTVRTAREVLRASGFSPDLVCLAPEYPGEDLGATLSARPEIRLIDHAGPDALGERLAAQPPPHTRVFTHAGGVNTILVDSTDDYRGMLTNLAFTLCLYSGQLPSSPQNILLPRGGIETDEGHRGYDQVVADLVGAVDETLADESFACALLGAVADPSTVRLLERAGSGVWGEVALRPRHLNHPEFPGAAVHSPALVKLDAAVTADRVRLRTVVAGPVYFVAAVADAGAGVALLGELVRAQGALVTGAYTTSDDVTAALEDVCADAGVSLTLNLTDDWYLTQSSVYSDLYGTGANHAANAAFCDAAYVADRFRTIQVNRPTSP